MLLRERGDDKIEGRHRDRVAVVYVRQSSRRQVVDHGESTRLQYGLVERAVALGWSGARVLVIDEDLGRSTSQSSINGCGQQSTTHDPQDLTIARLRTLRRSGKDCWCSSSGSQHCYGGCGRHYNRVSQHLTGSYDCLDALRNSGVRSYDDISEID